MKRSLPDAMARINQADGFVETKVKRLKTQD